MEFLPMNKRYDYTQFLPNYSTIVIEDYADKYDDEYQKKI